MSEDALTNPQKLMVLIHGSGVVRAGQWARRLIINEDLDSGTQIPFIKRALDVSETSFVWGAFYSSVLLRIVICLFQKYILSIILLLSHYLPFYVMIIILQLCEKI